MKKASLKIGNAQAFWGDRSGAAASLLKQQPDLDYITLDYLSEVSMSILGIQKEKDPYLGYAKDFLDVVRSLIPFWKKGSRCRLIANAGGLNPKGCAMACADILHDAGLGSLRLGIVSGDDVLQIIKDEINNPLYNNLESGRPLAQYSTQLVTANAYFGSKPIVEALNQQADIVITGRVADPSLTVAPCAAHYGWSWEDFDRLANATVAGHLIECGTQVTGGFTTNWLEVPDQTHIGFPFVEVDEDGSFVITKPHHTGGLVSIETVKEQLLYEIGDPDNYLSPDVSVSFLNLKLRQHGKDRVHVEGGKGRPPSPYYKVSATYRNGFKCEGMLTIFGPDACNKAKMCGNIILQRVKETGYEIEHSLIECLGSMAITNGVLEPSENSLECLLRINVADSRQEALEVFSKEIAPLVTSGPQGVTGYTSGRPKIRQVFGYWPCLIDVKSTNPQVEILEVEKWAEKKHDYCVK